MKCTSKLNRPTFDSRHNIEIRIKPSSELAQFHIKDIEMSSKMRCIIRGGGLE